MDILTAITAPLWIIGPSLPTASPPNTDKVTPTALQKRVLILTTRGTYVGEECTFVLLSVKVVCTQFVLCFEGIHDVLSLFLKLHTNIRIP